jgi:hypothetical protein
MRSRRLRIGVITALACCGMATTVPSSAVAAPGSYVLRHPRREHCAMYYTKSVVHVAQHINGYTKTVRETVCKAPNSYVLRHPRHERCKAHYARKLATVKKRVHGHTKRVRETICVYIRAAKVPPSPALQPVASPPIPISAPAPSVAASTRRTKQLHQPAPPREQEVFTPTCTATFTGAEGNAWGSAANWTGGIPRGLAAYGCIPAEYPDTVTFGAGEEDEELGGVAAMNAGGLTLEGGDLTLTNAEQKSAINDVKPGITAVTLGQGVLLDLTGATGELGGSTWNGPGTLEIPNNAIVRTGVCARWGGGAANRCVEGTPTRGGRGLHVKNLGIIFGAGLSLCRDEAPQPALLENEGAMRLFLSGSFGSVAECGEGGTIVNGERGTIGIAELDGNGCNVHVVFGSLVNKGAIRIGSCISPETAEVQRPKLEIDSTLSEAGKIADGGIVEIGGDYVPAASADLTIGIKKAFPEGSPETNYGTIRVAGSAALAGELNVETSGYLHFAPALGQTFRIVEVSGVLSGEFTLGNHCIPIEPGNGYKVDYKPGSKGTVTLEVAEVAGC